jgi:hypothetical protein
VVTPEIRRPPHARHHARNPHRLSTRPWMRHSRGRSGRGTLQGAGSRKLESGPDPFDSPPAPSIRPGLEANGTEGYDEWVHTPRPGSASVRFQRAGPMTDAERRIIEFLMTSDATRRSPRLAARLPRGRSPAGAGPRADHSRPAHRRPPRAAGDPPRHGPGPDRRIRGRAGATRRPLRSDRGVPALLRLRAAGALGAVRARGMARPAMLATAPVPGGMALRTRRTR